MKEDGTVTMTTTGKEKKEKKKKGFLDWLVSICRPGSHIAKNPPNGIVRVRKVKSQVEVAG